MISLKLKYFKEILDYFLENNSNAAPSY